MQILSTSQDNDEVVSVYYICIYTVFQEAVSIINTVPS